MFWPTHFAKIDFGSPTPQFLSQIELAQRPPRECQRGPKGTELTKQS